jgi:DNA processing protein
MHFPMKEELKFLIALSMIPSVGPLTARKLIAYTGSAEAVFKEKRKSLEKIPGIGFTLASRATSGKLLEKAEKEILFCQSRQIEMLDCYAWDLGSRLAATVCHSRNFSRCQGDA